MGYVKKLFVTGQFKDQLHHPTTSECMVRLIIEATVALGSIISQWSGNRENDRNQTFSSVHQLEFYDWSIFQKVSIPSTRNDQHNF